VSHPLGGGRRDLRRTQFNFAGITRLHYGEGRTWETEKKMLMREWISAHFDLVGKWLPDDDRVYMADVVATPFRRVTLFVLWCVVSRTAIRCTTWTSCSGASGASTTTWTACRATSTL